MKQILNAVKWLTILCLMTGLAFFVYAGLKITQPLLTSAPEKKFIIKPGDATGTVAKNLEQEGLIEKAFFFKFYILLKKSGHRIIAGNYSLSPAMSIVQIAKKLTGGEVIQNEIKFTVIEGWSALDIAESLETSGLTSGRDFLRMTPENFLEEFEFLKDAPKNYYLLEGYLFPDTYLIVKDATPKDIARKMLANFDKKLSLELREKISSQGKTIREVLILASIIEREVGRNVKKGTKLGQKELEKLSLERRLAASVFYNRLQIGKPLESDATISYITGRKGSSRATLEETKIDSPYNTYRYPGLPPAPISNPSLDSIRAAVEPADTGYLFFLTDKNGTAYYARTLEEHMANRTKYLGD